MVDYVAFGATIQCELTFNGDPPAGLRWPSIIYTFASAGNSIYFKSPLQTNAWKDGMGLAALFA
jgi:hypothetical protein